ncbi:carbohydrate sulfotransferase 11-like isoform X2 [Pecten maximus]|uniref:carbohydrate sulfotransferase 11-like isoform X2 n=1 Tax=Pecten maximus TaxID=6579 RepID=UPI00145885C8|nr:carbohydrate sulfotransferase 11-like isoform X2 [Pecten maximus]
MSMLFFLTWYVSPGSVRTDVMMRWKLKNVLPGKMVRRCNDSLLKFGLLGFLGLFIIYLQYKPAPVTEEHIPDGLIEVRADENGRHLMKEFAAKRRKRRLLLNDACQNSTENHETLDIDQLDHIIVNDKYKALFCYVPKVACSQWKRVFLMMSGNVSDPKTLDEYSVHTTYSHLLRYLNTYEPGEIKHKIKNYKKFIMVRNPLDRLVSAFKNKFHGTGFKDARFKNIGKYIVRTYRKKFTEPVFGDDVTFLEFVRYVIDNKVGVRDEHWRSITDLCKPCQIDYDFIGKQETINEDADFIMSQMAPHIEFPVKPAVYGSSNTTKSTPFYLSQLPFGHVGRLWDIYRDDFVFFNYSFLKHVDKISYLVR